MSDNIISKELLSEVLGKDIGRVEVNDDVEFWWSKTDTYCGIINIYELAHRCKEWALTNGYIIASSLNNGSRIHGFCAVQKSTGGDIIYCSSENTEPEAVFKACQWLLINKDKL